MKNRYSFWEKGTILAAAFAASALAFAACAGAGGEDAVVPERACYPVARVVDGDTFKIDLGDGEVDTVRMLGIDTPETVKPNAPVEPYGKEASDFTKKLLNGKIACLELDVGARDRFDRLLAYVYLEDGTFVNERLVAEGYATVLVIPPNVRFAKALEDAEREARRAERGLWNDAAIV
ncbi:MAG TPA: thermonuclease family protein, partial [Paenibacillus sp.]|nr:thermonuclease family protein [Paenibacillus sp.]